MKEIIGVLATYTYKWYRFITSIYRYQFEMEMNTCLHKNVVLITIGVTMRIFVLVQAYLKMSMKPTLTKGVEFFKPIKAFGASFYHMGMRFFVALYCTRWIGQYFLLF